MRKLFITFSFLLLLLGLSAQDNDTRSSLLEQKMRWYGAAADKGLLFVHFDKNIYTNSEQAWFTGYLLHPPVHVDSNHTMAVALIRNEDSVVVAEEKYLMADGFSFGNMLLPDSLPPGFYSFVAYTNLVENGKPQAIFVQPVTIKTMVSPSFLASLKLAPRKSADSVTVLLKADSKDIFSLIANASVTYSIGSGKQTINGKTKTDAYGSASITVPVKHLTTASNLLKVQVNYKNEKKQLQIRLPLADNVRIGIYPESGHLVAGFTNQIGWEAKTPEGTPLNTQAFLYKNDMVTDTLRTNVEGIGRFSLFAEAGSNYSIRMPGKDTLYALPKPVGGIPLLQVTDAVSDDTLRITVSSQQAGKWYCMIHDYTELYAGFDVTADNATARGFKIPLADVPRGLLTVTLLDAAGEPVAERMAFAHYNQKDKVTVITDSAVYHTRQKVTVKLKLNPSVADTAGGTLSVACVQESRLDTRNNTDIESYTYLSHQLADLPLRKDPMGDGEGNKEFLNKILLVKGWRKYNWSGLQKAVGADTMHARIASLKLKGSVTKFEDHPSKPVFILLAADTYMKELRAATDGSFEIRQQDMVITPDRKVVFVVREKNKAGYNLKVEDPYAAMNRQFFSWLPDEETGLRYFTSPNSDSMALKAGDKPPTLATVTVSANLSDGNPYTVAARNNCGDYVCPYGVLNCMNHTWGTPPKAGKRYPKQMGTQGVTYVMYSGCIEDLPENKFALFVKGIYTGKEFYVPDYTKISKSEPMFLSTLFWDYATVVNSSGETELSFYTSDITGRFRIVAQGVTTNGVTHAETSFTVVSK